ncbi:nitrate reductase molybdenum cofactor assembly chaperone [Streptomyces sp. INA 01156]
MLTSTVAALPASPAAGHLAGFTAWLTAQEPDALERHYVELFDLRRKSSLYLTYYLHGDTRRRGMALLILNQRYRAAGWDTDGGELPTTSRSCWSSPPSWAPARARRRCVSTGADWS